MAGHSKWANIKRTKEAEDKKRASAFTKASKDIAVAARLSETGDVNLSPMLKVAVDKAKAINMPNDKIKKAIDRGLGISDTEEIIQENTYELYGPEGTAFLVDCETDNPNRTITDIKTLANKIGLKVANAGSISWQFEEVGLIEVNTEKGDMDDVSLQVMEIENIKDIQRNEKKLTIFTDRTSLKQVVEEVKKLSNVEITQAELVKQTDNVVVLNEAIRKKVNEIEEALSEVQDVVNIWKNY